MSFKNTLNRTKRIEFGEDGHIEVRGLALPDIHQLVAVNYDEIAPLFDRFTGRDASNPITADDIDNGIMVDLVAKFPAIAAHVIALAADEPAAFSDIMKLPLGVQVAALEAIGTMTFSAPGGLKNFLETVLAVARGANGLRNQMIEKPRN